MSEHRIRITINGQNRQTTVEGRMTLADFLRVDAGYTGVHVGCEHGVCGACTVIVNGKAVRSCLMLAIQADGHDVTTIEGLGSADNLHPMQVAFNEHHGLQCGFCTPGMIMSAVDFAKRNPDPTPLEVREWLEGNICRCTGYHNIVASVEAGARAMAKG